MRKIVIKIFYLVILLFSLIFLLFVLLLQPEDRPEIISDPNTLDEMRTEVFQLDSGENVFVYGKARVLNGDKQVPMVLFLTGTGGDPEEQSRDTGWQDKTRTVGLIVISPEYNNTSTYSAIDTIIDVVNQSINLYPIDEQRIYSLGFSNGGAMSVALASEHPERFAGIAAYGWMVDMRNTENGNGNQGIPFQVIQGDNEFVEQNDQGEMVVMPDEQRAIRSLFLYNQMISEQVLPDYGTTPYWGYAPDNMKQEQVRNRNWTINDYHREGFDNPLLN